MKDPFVPELPPIGCYVTVPWGSCGARQVAHVVAHSRTGRVRCRAWNKSRGEWMPGLRTLSVHDLKPAGSLSAGLPEPPAIPARA